MRVLTKPSKPDIFSGFFKIIYWCTTLFGQSLVSGDKKPLEWRRSLVRDLIKPFRPHILSVLRFLQCIDKLLCCDKMLSMG